MNKKAFLYSLGCKINRYEIEYIREILSEFEFSFSNDYNEADLIVVNTCTVTKKSENRSKQYIRKFIKSNPNAFVIVTGCAVQFTPENFADIEGIDLILGNIEKDDFRLFFKKFKDLRKNEFPILFVNKKIVENNYSFPEHIISDFSNRTRAFLKIQDGCEHFCSYCIVPYLRGRYRSRPIENVIEQIKKFEDKGFKEVVLTGIHLGKYGMETKKSLLSLLLKRILEETSIERIRLTSIEPTELSDEIIEIISQNNRICKHLHVPLQSGNDKILKLMNRKYTTDYYRKKILKLVDLVPDIGIGVDLIVGHPGETEDDFLITYNFIKELPPLYLHVFSYSDRPGTVSYKMPDKVSKNEIKSRTKRMIMLGMYKRGLFYNKFIGEKMQILVESEPDHEGFQNGLTSNFIRVYFKSNKVLKNEFIDVKLTYINDENRVIGELV